VNVNIFDSVYFIENHLYFQVSSTSIATSINRKQDNQAREVTRGV